MNLDRHISEVCRVFTQPERLGFVSEHDLYDWLRTELGSAEILDGPVQSDTGWKHAIAPSGIYHLCAGNLSIAAETSLLIALVLGSRAWFKLPSSGLTPLEALVEDLSDDMKSKITLLKEHDPEIMKACDAVVAYGSNETLEAVRREISWKQLFVCYGHKISLGSITGDGISKDWAERAVEEIMAYDQLGCLSPQSYLCSNRESAAAFTELLVSAFERYQIPETSKLPFEAQALIFESRQRAIVAGDLVVTPDNPASWTVVQREASRIEPGPGFGFIEVVPVEDRHELLQPWRNLISSVSLSSTKISEEEWAFWQHYGVHRICQMGNLQRPPLAWPHDGRPRIADLIRWCYADPDIEVVHTSKLREPEDVASGNILFQ
ncbi:MAG: acyl-CoA reductase [Verrucomicrobiota bacterium]